MEFNKHHHIQFDACESSAVTTPQAKNEKLLEAGSSDQGLTLLDHPQLLLPSEQPHSTLHYPIISTFMATNCKNTAAT